VLVRGSDGHRERFMITGTCYGRAPVGAAWSVGVLLVGAGPVGLVEHRPRRPEAAHSLSLDRRIDGVDMTRDHGLVFGGR
jgi:hypothetical protein